MFGEPMVVFDHALRKPEELALAVIDEAEYFGFSAGLDQDVVEWFLDPENNPEPEEGDEETWKMILDEVHDAAIDFLNTNVAEEGMVYYHDGEAGAFLYAPIEEKEE